MQPTRQRGWSHHEPAIAADGGPSGAKLRSNHAVPNAAGWQGELPQAANRQHPRRSSVRQGGCGAVHGYRPIGSDAAPRQQQETAETRSVQVPNEAACHRVTAGFGVGEGTPEVRPGPDPKSTPHRQFARGGPICVCCRHKRLSPWLQRRFSLSLSRRNWLISNATASRLTPRLATATVKPSVLSNG